MRRVVLILPGILGEPSVLAQARPGLRRLLDAGRVVRIAPAAPVETLEALWLGLRSDEGQLRQGPLTVSALGADPPERSLHFHLSVGSLQSGRLHQLDLALPENEARTIETLAPKLDTPTLTFVKGEQLDHALVWESLGDLRTTSIAEASDLPIPDALPEGDGEPIFRRYIDDSVNLLAECEFNLRRQDEGLPPANILWPWGHGIRYPVPNLALRRGEPARVESGSIRLAGLARLAGYRHGSRSWAHGALGKRAPAIRERLEPGSVVVVDALPAELRKSDRLDELDWYAAQLDSHVFQPLAEALPRERVALLVACPGSESGLALIVDPSASSDVRVPFDEHSLDERLPTYSIEALVDRTLSPTD